MKFMRSVLVMLVLCFLALPLSLPAASYGPYSVLAPVAVDGDTLRADVMLWPTLTADVAIRVRAVDTPEIKAVSACERELGQAAKAFTDRWLLAHQPITITNVGMDKYSGRIDAIVLGADGQRLSDALIQSGHGRPYHGGQRKPWCKKEE